MNSTLPDETHVLQCSFLTYYEMKKTTALTAISVTVTIWNGILLVVALIANGLVCTAILINSDLRKRTSNTLLLLLSMSDFFVGLAVQPMYFIRRLLELHDRYVCWVLVTYRVLWHLSIGTSFLILCFISCERYIALFFAFKYKQIISTTRILFFTGFFVISWTLFVISRFLGVESGKYYTAATSFIIIFVTIIIFVYFRIYRLALRHHSQIHSLHQNASTVAKERKVTKTTAYIIGSVLLCYSPLLISLVAVKFFEDKLFHYYVFPITDCMVFCNSTLNPLIYCWRNAELRRCIARLTGIKAREEISWCSGGVQEIKGAVS